MGRGIRHHQTGLGITMPRISRRAGAAHEYVYPDHLRHCLEGLPAAPGVYIFHTDDLEGMPLYIGKSVNIRHRVMSHFRTIEEFHMLRQARSVTFIRTAGEIGALLLEARMIKERQPLFNQKLRRTRQLCSLRLRDGIAEVVYARDMNFAIESDLHGLFSSRTSALEGLRELADTHRLCYGKVGLEKLPIGRKCFRATIGQCAGACCGTESLEVHANRFTAALKKLRVACWPYPGAVGLIECHDGEAQIHVVRNWCYLATVTNVVEAAGLGKVEAGFDADGYKILCRAIFNNSVEIIHL